MGSIFDGSNQNPWLGSCVDECRMGRNVKQYLVSLLLFLCLVLILTVPAVADLLIVPSSGGSSVPAPAGAIVGYQYVGTLANNAALSINWQGGNQVIFQCQGTNTINTPTNPVTGMVYTITLIYNSINACNATTLTWPTIFKAIDNSNFGTVNDGPSTNTGPANSWQFVYDGANYRYAQASEFQGWNGFFRSLNLGGVPASSTGTSFNFLGQFQIDGDNDVSSASRIPLHFDEGTETALTANESLGTYKTSKAITIENIELDIKKSPTCTTTETITCFDCGASAGACTSGQTATISTTNVATGATRQSVDQSITTANVAASHYISCIITAGACTVSDNSISMMARPQ